MFEIIIGYFRPLALSSGPVGHRADINSQQLATIVLGGIRTTILSWKLSGFESDLKAEGKKLWETLEILFKK